MVLDRIYLIGEKVGEYRVQKLLGEGRYGIAYLGKNELGEEVVIKQLKQKALRRIGDRVKYEQNILEDLTALNSNHFPKYKGQFQDGKIKGYFLEYKKGKTFEEIIYKDKHIFTRIEIYEIAEKLIEIMSLLESQKIVHKDIRVANVVQMQDGELALIDFGLSRYIDAKGYKASTDFWYLADFLIHLYYTDYHEKTWLDKPWYKQLSLTNEERRFLRRLMKLDAPYEHLDQVKEALRHLKK